MTKLEEDCIWHCETEINDQNEWYKISKGDQESLYQIHQKLKKLLNKDKIDDNMAIRFAITYTALDWR